LSRKLTLDDIADLRAYEQERPAHLERIIALKSNRRMMVGPFVTFVFENRDTMRFQIQEMARAEKMIRIEQIEEELAAYNPLIPDPGELSTTMLIELRTEEELREWLPKLVGIERKIVIRIGSEKVAAAVDPSHAEQLTREDVTSAVHYVRFKLTETQIEAFARESVALAIEHPSYRYETPFSEETKASLLEDLRSDA
jgi:hypothetical protein